MASKLVSMKRTLGFLAGVNPDLDYPWKYVPCNIIMN
jgi:hypothetical protein